LEEASGMVVLTSSDTRRRLANPARLLLRRRAMIYPPTPARIGVNPDAAAPVHAGVNPAAAAPVHAGVNPAAGVDLLETDLVDRGWLLGPALRDALVRLDVAELVNVGATLLADCDALLGADRPHVPLFRDFPASTPDDTMAFFVDRILTAWFQTPDQPCVLCDTDDTVAPVNPCGHLVCRACFDGADFSACPICHRRINPDDPFVKPARPRPLRGESAAPERLRVLHLGFDQDADLRAELVGLLARTAALPPADADDLATLLALQPRIDLSWLPARVPGRETKARLLAWLLTDPLPAGALDRAAALVDTATDVLRLLVVRSDGDASLIGRPRLAPVPRPLRRALLGLLDCIGTVRLVDDMRRHRRAWIAVGEKLHPGEYADRYPAVALAFATLRCSDMTTLCPRTAVAGQVAEDVRIDDAGRVTVAVWGHRVESALADGDVATAVSLLAARPGELLRRLDHLLRLAATDEDLAAAFAALTAAAPQVSPAVLLSALGQVRTRTARHRTRVFFPAGRTSTAHVIDDERAVLPSGVVARAVDILQAEALRRAATLRRVDRAVIDTRPRRTRRPVRRAHRGAGAAHASPWQRPPRAARPVPAPVLPLDAEHRRSPRRPRPVGRPVQRSLGAHRHVRLHQPACGRRRALRRPDQCAAAAWRKRVRRPRHQRPRRSRCPLRGHGGPVLQQRGVHRHGRGVRRAHAPLRSAETGRGLRRPRRRTALRPDRPRQGHHAVRRRPR